jgi:hypothetical protein
MDNGLCSDRSFVGVIRGRKTREQDEQIHFGDLAGSIPVLLCEHRVVAGLS